jgi:divalent metal cation (Fe/Co/Zn/Cd) transporter
VLDPLIALAVAVNILATGGRLVGRSAGGLMDRAVEPAERAEIDAVLDRFARDGVQFHAVRTRQAGSRAFVSLHVLVPGAWTVQRGHDLVEEIEAAVLERLPYATVFTHLEPAEDPRSFGDASLDRR